MLPYMLKVLPSVFCQLIPSQNQALIYEESLGLICLLLSQVLQDTEQTGILTNQYKVTENHGIIGGGVQT
jgi:hypothetical protein